MFDEQRFIGFEKLKAILSSIDFWSDLLILAVDKEKNLIELASSTVADEP
jgi:hypothetical protein